MINQSDTNIVKENKTDANNEHTGGNSSSFSFLGRLSSTKRPTRMFKPLRNINLLELLADESSSESPPLSPKSNDKEKKKDVDNILNTSFIESTTQSNIETVDIQSKLNDSFIEPNSSKSLTSLLKKCSLDDSERDSSKDLLILNDNPRTDELLINNITEKSLSVQKTQPNKNSVEQLDNLKYQTPRNDSSSKMVIKHDMFRTPLLRQHSVLSMIKERSSSAVKEKSVATCLFKQKDNSLHSSSKQNPYRLSTTPNKTNLKFNFSSGQERNRDFDIKPLKSINEDLQGVELKKESVNKTSDDRKKVLNENSVETNSEARKCNEKQDNDAKQISVEKENVSPVNVQFNIKSIGSKTIHPNKLKTDKLISEQPTKPIEQNATKPVAKQKQNVQFSLPMPTINNKQFGSITVKGKTYTVLSKLGEGGSSQVYQVLNPETSQIHAVKCVNLSSSLVASGCINEIQLLLKLQGSDRVIKMFDYEHVEKEKLLYVVMEKGDIDLAMLLRNATSSRTAHLPTPMIIYYWTEMLTAVKHIHDNGIIHSDLKPGNFLLVMGRLKLIDFGISSCVQAEMTSVIKNTQTGTFHYISPETLMDTRSDDTMRSPQGRPRIKISYKSDVWSLGCILYNLIYRCTPFQHLKNQWATLAAITNPEYQIRYPEAPHCPPILMETLKRCLTFEPKKRPTVAELLEIPYISFQKTV